MHSSLTAVVLCMFAHVAAAECVAAAPLAGDVRTGTEVMRTSAMSAPAAAPVRSGGELIRTAAAGTRDAPPAPRGGTVLSMRDSANGMQSGEDEPPRRSGTAMLLAALALMSGIVLRRYGANKQ